MRYFLVLVCFLACSSCDTFPKSAYSIGSMAIYDVKGEIPFLCNRLEDIAIQNKLIKQLPKRQNTLCYFSESKLNSIVIGARSLNKQLVVDIQVLNNMKTYRKLKLQIEEMLKLNYPENYLEVITP
ncbi:hypothetical protein [Agitococcus lubricus]|uniref:Uncharacterized protein n=1 Tax=Agitococcus lubricus TaxID=1077255 RepID=A0A2T5IZJ5_9GAMM|nr:hypothetical protein [Agitococcus lubricus]PTQ89478.1 hypothetical protein C8N29_1069 [Agitococcus lubricus]